MLGWVSSRMLRGRTVTTARPRVDVLFVMRRNHFGKVLMRSLESYRGNLRSVIVYVDHRYRVKHRVVVML